MVLSIGKINLIKINILWNLHATKNLRNLVNYFRRHTRFFFTPSAAVPNPSDRRTHAHQQWVSTLAYANALATGTDYIFP